MSLAYAHFPEARLDPPCCKIMDDAECWHCHAAMQWDYRRDDYPAESEYPGLCSECFSNLCVKCAARIVDADPLEDDDRVCAWCRHDWAAIVTEVLCGRCVLIRMSAD